MTHPNESSEQRCARHMYCIMRGWTPLKLPTYTVDEVAERYGVHRDTAYKGIRARSPMFPAAQRKNDGPRAWLSVTREALEQCDRDRLAFYKTTPSWYRKYVKGSPAAPPRRAARMVIDAAERAGRRKA